jgi:hypothetical protein
MELGLLALQDDESRASVNVCALFGWIWGLCSPNAATLVSCVLSFLLLLVPRSSSRRLHKHREEGEGEDGSSPGDA